MNWNTSNRKDRLPSNWSAIRKQVLARDMGRCRAHMADGRACPDRATEVDHIRHGDDHSLSNLQALCRWHHARKSSSEGAQERAAMRKKSHNVLRWQDQDERVYPT